MKKKTISALLLAFLVFAGGCNDKEKEENQEAYRQIGINRMEEGKYDEAVEAFQSALDQSLARIGERELDICYYKAEAQYLAGNVSDAQKTYTALIEYDKKDAKAYYLRGCMYLAEGRGQEAKEDFAAAVKYEKNDYELYIGIYGQLSAAGESGEAAEYLESALEISGKSAEDYLQRGRIYLLTGDNEKAKEALETALEKENGEAKFYLGQMYEAAGEDEKAQKMYESYAGDHTDDAKALVSLADISLRRGEYEKAVSYLKKAQETKEGENSRRLQKKLIAACEMAGNFADAKREMERYIKDCPEDKKAEREYEFLKTR